MKQFFIFFLLFPLILRANIDAVFSDDQDLTLCHHVNVISGNFNLYFQDAVVQGAQQLSLVRTYTSAGALERSYENNDLELKRLRNDWLIQGGWSFLPHASLFVQTSDVDRKVKIFLPEKNGMVIQYVFSHRDDNFLVLRPDLKSGQCSGILSARTNPQNNVLKFDPVRQEARLFLPDGGSRYYKNSYRNSNDIYCIDLKLEEFPSSYRAEYKFDQYGELTSISMMNHNRSKTFAWMKFKILKLDEGSHHFRFQVTTSDTKLFDYQSVNFKLRNYLNGVQSNCRPLESAHFVPGRKGIGARMESLALANCTQFKVHYFKPPNEKQEKKWAESPEKKDFITDKVSMIEAPIGPCGRLLPVARFSYRPGLTEVRDADHILTRYHHDQFRLHLIDYCDEKDRVCSYLKFVWEGSRLKAKTMLGPEAEGLFSRTFQYDQFGNVVEETLWGNLTGNASDSFVFQPDGTLSGAESYRKRYVYLPDFNIPILEEEEEGPTYRYVYKPHSNLLSAKFTCDKEKILFRQFFIYNEDNLLIGEIEDDGCSNDLNDFAYVKERRYKRYDLDPSNGMTRSVTETYWDPASGNERLLKKVEYAYSPQNLVIAEAVYDANGQYRYTVHTDHNAHGHVISKTTPMGQKSTYAYDPFGNLLESKEVGSLKKIYTYNRVSQPLSCEEIDSEGSRRISHSVYDSKGRLLSQTNSRGNATHQRHDAFGKCLETQLPKIKDEQGNAYSPVIRFSYDKLGNIASTTSNGNETTRTTYNTLRKPIRIIQPDGTEISHVYNKKGSLTKTIYPDGTQAHYAYDILQRMTSKMIYSASGELLSQELWSYNAFHLVSHTDPRGLITTYDYDGAGRLISETSGEKQNHFTYDPLGFLTRTTDGNLTQVKIHDEGGRVIEEWIEDLNGRSENHMRFVYDE